MGNTLSKKIGLYTSLLKTRIGPIILLAMHRDKEGIKVDFMMTCNSVKMLMVFKYKLFHISLRNEIHQDANVFPVIGTTR